MNFLVTSHPGESLNNGFVDEVFITKEIIMEPLLGFPSGKKVRDINFVLIIILLLFFMSEFSSPIQLTFWSREKLLKWFWNLFLWKLIDLEKFYSNDIWLFFYLKKSSSWWNNFTIIGKKFEKGLKSSQKCSKWNHKYPRTKIGP